MDLINNYSSSSSDTERSVQPSIATDQHDFTAQSRGYSVYDSLHYTTASTFIEPDLHQTVEDYSVFSNNVRNNRSQPPLTSTMDHQHLDRLLNLQHSSQQVDTTLYHTLQPADPYVDLTAYHTPPVVDVSENRSSRDMTSDSPGDPPNQSSSFRDQSSSSQDQTLPSRINDRPADLTEPHVRNDQPPTEVPDLPQENEPFEVIHDGDIIYFYTRMLEGTNKRKELIIEHCDGDEHRLVKKHGRDNWDNFPEYLCENAKNENKCPGRFFPKSDNDPSTNKCRTVAERRPHTCRPDPLKYRTSLAKKEVKNRALTTTDTGSRIAEVARAKHFREVDFGLEGKPPPKRRHLEKQANHIRRTNNIRNPRSVGLEFELRVHMKEVVYNDMFKKDLRVRGGARHIVFATNQMIQRLREARAWYFDATFKCVDKKLFSQVSFT